LVILLSGKWSEEIVQRVSYVRKRESGGRATREGENRGKGKRGESSTKKMLGWSNKLPSASLL